MNNSKKKILLLLVVLLLLPNLVFAEIIFSENYDSITNGWNCSNAVPSGWTSLPSCTVRNYGGITHYGGEISSGGRTGNSLKQWKAPGTNESGYNGYINYNFNSNQFNNHYRTLYFRTYVKIPPQLDAVGCIGGCPKFIGRIYAGPSEGSTATEVYLSLNSSTMKTARFQVTINLATAPFDNIYTTADVASFGLFDGNWHALELGIHAGTYGQANGEVHLYVDGIERQIAGGSGESPSIGQTKVAFNWPSNYYISSPFVPGVGNLTLESTARWTTSDDQWHAIEWDDYAIATSYIGLTGDGDRTAPAAPNGLTIF